MMEVHREHFQHLHLFLLVTLVYICQVWTEGADSEHLCKAPKHCSCYNVPQNSIGYNCALYNVKKGDTFPFLKGPRIVELEVIWQSSFTEPERTYLRDGILAWMPNLREISFIGSIRHRFTSDTFAGLPHLERLTIFTANPDTRFDSDWLQPLAGLRSLTLPGNFITQFPPEHFCGLQNLTTLAMFTNSFTKTEDLGIECNDTMSSEAQCHPCLPNVTVLNLSFNNFTVFDVKFGKDLPSLTTLRVSYSGLYEIRGLDMSTVLSVAVLDLSHNHLSAFPVIGTDACYDSEMLILWLQHNQLRSLPRGLFTCTRHLTHLDLSENHLSTEQLVQAGLGDLQELVTLNVSGNSIVSLQAGMIDTMTQLTYFSCSRCGMNHIDRDSLSNTTGLIFLQLDHNNISFIDNNTFTNLNNLTTLDLSNNKLLWFEVKTVSISLEQLALGNNYLQRIPDFSGSWPNLVSLNLSGNSIKDFEPMALIGLTSLKHLFLASNQITYIPASRFLSLKALTQLDLSNNMIKKVELFAFSLETSLTFVNLSFNMIEDSNMREVFHSSVKHLLMNGNRLREIPFNLAFLHSLERLDVSFNNISAIADQVFGELHQLKMVNLTYNNLHSLNPRKLAVSPQATTILEVYLQGNPLHCDCHNVLLKAANSDISGLDYYRRECQSRGLTVKAFTETYLNGLRLAKVPDLDVVYCDTVKSSENQSLAFLPIEEFLCPYLAYTSGKNDCDIFCTCYQSGFDFVRFMDCSHQNMTTLPVIWQQGTQTIFLNGNDIQEVRNESFTHDKMQQLEKLYLQDNNITLIERGGFQNLTVLNTLHLHNNSLTWIDLTLFQETPSLKHLTLHGNPWRCDCMFGPAFKDFITVNAKIIERPNTIMCMYSNDTQSAITKTAGGVLFTKPLLEEDFNNCRNSSQREILKHVTKHSIVGAVSVAAILVALVCIGIGLYSNRLLIIIWAYNRFGARFHHEDEDNEVKPYDVFIAHTREDEMFVVQNLLPQLEEGHLSYKVCVEIRDWPAGAIRTETIIASVQQSKRTILFVSESYFDTQWCRYEFLAAHNQVLKDRQLRLIIILADESLKSRVESDVALYLKTGTYLVYGEKHFWQKLRYYLADNPRGVTNMDDLELLKVYRFQ